MGIIEEITKMQKQGLPEQEIISNLKQRGVSPKEINDALSQAKIKNAVSNENSYDQSTQEQNQNNYVPQPGQYSQTQEAPQEQYAPQLQDMPPQGQDNYFPVPSEYPQQEQYPQGEFEYPDSTDTDVLIEISGQIFSEKIKPIKKKVDSLTEFKTISETKINNMEDRLKRIERIIDKLQIDILEKISSYGSNLSSIKKEMNMMQDSFRKVIDHKIKTHKKSSPKKKASKKNSKKK